MRDSVVGAGCTVGEGAHIEGAVLGRDVTVEPGAEITGMVVAGDGSTVPAGLHLSGPADVPTGSVASG